MFQINIPSQLHDLRVKSQPLPEVNVTTIGSGIFANYTQLSQITIPSSVTHIGSDAFKNTNNASIYLNGRTFVPSTFDLNWNSSANPVYFNGILCNHSSKTIIELNATQHGDLCNSCRTIVNKANHNKYTSGLWEYCWLSILNTIGRAYSYNLYCVCSKLGIGSHMLFRKFGPFRICLCLGGGPEIRTHAHYLE